MNYARISEAIEFYKSVGYEYVETPWIVERGVKKLTSGSTLENVPGFTNGAGNSQRHDLVGSAEQGFIQLMRAGKLESGKLYVSAGPCFRFADAGRSPLHHPYFFKVELFRPDSVEFEPLLKIARGFFWRQATSLNKVTTVNTEFEQDLCLNDIEIGSYGFRAEGQFSWSYGTGLAEPRFSEALGKS